MKTYDLLIEEGKRFITDNNLVSARDALERAIVMIESEHGLHAQELITPLSWLAKAYRGDHYNPCSEVEKSISVMARALLIAEAPPCDEPRLAAMLTFQGLSLWFNGEHERALEAVARSLELAKHWTTDTTEQTRLLAEILHSAGRSADALVYAHELVRQAEERPSGTQLKSYAQLLLADCLRQAGQKTEARAIILEILAWDDAGNEEVKKVVRQWLDELEVTT
jgi:hypothetical protein